MITRTGSLLAGWSILPVCLAALLPPGAKAQDPSAGLWVGRAMLGQVNEVVSAVNADNVRVQTPPGETTPTSDMAEILLILHVDDGGVVRLLKSVAVVDENDDPLVGEPALITDPNLYADHVLARRIASVAFEFGDPDSKVVVGGLATAAAQAAIAGADVLQAATDAVNNAAAGDYSDSLAAFIASSDFTGSASTAAAAAQDAAAERYAEGLRGTELENAVRSDVLIDLNTVSQMADGATLNEVAMAGSLASGGEVSGQVFLGAYHPSNPFRHRRHPTHRGGYDIERHITMTVNEPDGGDDFDTTDRGLDRLTGVYKEQVFGLHKPLGQAGEYGLITMGSFVLDRISHDPILND